MRQKHVLLIGNFREVYAFIPLLQKEGLAVTTADNFERALETAKTLKPDGIVFMHPPYWERVAHFAESIRKEEGMEDVKILYLASEIEGNDQPMLQKYHVRTMTIGPVPEEEIVRFITKELLF